jgi:CubicO group peptidase (beta-lactamase class C family)
MNGRFEETLSPVIKDAIKTGRIVGASIIVAQEGKILFEEHAGMMNRDKEKMVDDKTIFRLASITKPIVNAAAMVLIEKGILKLDAPITDWLPNFKPKSPDKKSTPTITIRHLLTHTSGLSYGFLSKDNEPYRSAGVSDGMDEKVLSLEENLQRLATIPLMFNPGTSWCYSLSTDVLGAVMEKASGKSLPFIVEKYITGPLKMKDTTFNVNEDSISRLAVAYVDSSESDQKARPMQENDQVILKGCGPIHYAPNRITNKYAYPSGGAGMAGTAKDYLLFLEAIRQGGFPILQPDSVKLLTQDSVPNFDVDLAGSGYACCI